MIGIIACPITSGDTAFQSARLTIADWFKINQKSNTKRLVLTLPLLVVGAVLSTFDFGIIWRRCFCCTMLIHVPDVYQKTKAPT